MGRSLGRKCNFEKVCFELGTEYWQRRRVSGIRREWIWPTRVQLILNSAARAVTKTPKFHHITPHLKSLHWLKITQRIQYKILSLTYKSLQYNKPSSISDLLTIQPTRSTRSSAFVTLQRPPNPSRLKISDRSFYFQAPALWNALPHHLRSHSHSSQSHSLLSLSSSQFHKQLKTHLFLHSYPP